MDDRLYRSVDDRMLAGVAGGVAERLDADPSIIRVVWAMLIVLTGGIAFVAYIVMAIVVPEGPPEASDPASAPAAPVDARGPVAGAPPPDPDAATAATAVRRSSRPSSRPIAQPSPPRLRRPGPRPSVAGWLRTARPSLVPQPDRPAGASARARLATSGGHSSVARPHPDRGFFLLRQFLPAIDLGSWWPIILVAIGTILVIVSVMPDRKSG